MSSHKHISVTLDEETLKILDERMPIHRDGKQRGDRSFLLRSLLRRYNRMCNLAADTFFKSLAMDKFTNEELRILINAYVERALSPEVVAPIDFINIDRDLPQSIREKIEAMKFSSGIACLVLLECMERELYEMEKEKENGTK